MMKNEFYEIYTQIFQNSLTILRRQIRIKLRAIAKYKRHERKSFKLVMKNWIKRGQDKATSADEFKT